MMRATLFTALAVGTAASLGCAGAPDPELTATPQTTVLSVNDARIGSLSGVQVRVSPVTQTSRYQNEAEYRPAHVEIRNRSDRPLRVRYDAFALEAGGAPQAGAVPVLLIDRAGDNMPGVGGLSGAAWERRDFEIAGDYAVLYPDMPAYEGAFEATTVDAYRSRAGSAEPAGIRDQELLASTIPEGVIRPGGRVEGTLWFENIDQADSTLAFTMDLVDASTGEEFGTIQVPFDLTRSTLQRGSETWEARDPGAAETVDVTTVITTADPTSYESRRVQLNNVKVQKRVNDRVFWVGPDGGQWLLVTHGDPTGLGPISAVALQEGQSVTVVGTLREPPTGSEARAAWRLDQAGAEMLGRSRLYLVADDVRTY
jgi:hypothetical protein